MARGASGDRAKAEKTRRLTEALDSIISTPPYGDGFDPLTVSREVLGRLPNEADLPRTQAARIRKLFDDYVKNLPSVRERLDAITDPETTFDPANPDTVGRLVMLALLAQDRVKLSELRPTYGSGVYAIYYSGKHPAYAPISATETPIYVGKADPKEPRAATPRAQAARLFARLAEHRAAIEEVEQHALNHNAASPLRVEDFECRRLVCATNSQLVAERHLIDAFRPAWNAETKICYGISKHGDNANTRRNHKSPWDVLHPGRDWATNSPVRKGMTVESITLRLTEHFAKNRPHSSVTEVITKMLHSFRQVAHASADQSERAAKADEIVAAQLEDVDKNGDGPEVDSD